MKDEAWYCETCIQENLTFSSKKVNSNVFNSKHSNIDPNFKNLICQLKNLSEK